MLYKELKEYYLDVSSRIAEFEKRNISQNTLTKKSSGKYSFWIFFYSALDFFLLTIKLISIQFNKKSYALIYTQANLCAFENNHLVTEVIHLMIGIRIRAPLYLVLPV